MRISKAIIILLILTNIVFIGLYLWQFNKKLGGTRAQNIEDTNKGGIEKIESGRNFILISNREWGLERINIINKFDSSGQQLIFDENQKLMRISNFFLESDSTFIFNGVDIKFYDVKDNLSLSITEDKKDNAKFGKYISLWNFGDYVSVGNFNSDEPIGIWRHYQKGRVEVVNTDTLKDKARYFINCVK
jgi:hypothetical protein